MDDWPRLACIHCVSRTRLRRGTDSIRFVSGSVLVVDDEDPRNASIVGARSSDSTRSRGEWTARRTLVTGMSVTTPAEAELLVGYDRRRGEAEEQIGSGTLVRHPEVLDRWYEADKV